MKVKHKAIVVDLDGTLAINTFRKNGPYDASKCDEEDLQNVPVVETVRALAFAGYYCVFCSGREDKYKAPTQRFIQACFPEMNNDWALFMRQTGDNRRDSIVKREIYEEQIAPRFEILVWIDDRDQVVEMVRKDLNLPCFQVNYGNF